METVKNRYDSIVCTVLGRKINVQSKSQNVVLKIERSKYCKREIGLVFEVNSQIFAKYYSNA